MTYHLIAPGVLKHGVTTAGADLRAIMPERLPDRFIPIIILGTPASVGLAVTIMIGTAVHAVGFLADGTIEPLQAIFELGHAIAVRGDASAQVGVGPHGLVDLKVIEDSQVIIMQDDLSASARDLSDIIFIIDFASSAEDRQLSTTNSGSNKPMGTDTAELMATAFY